ncbi:hypothetical protein PORCRE_1075 [Porphyromonas crevioricanis JCM 15906]|uniref:Metal-binding protein n=1 Tax=Porphyromonas crevioricanis JCM 15906 TaxID=1305617 RepID=T1DRQ1_9PORP|nr:DUF2284 domain-containing protein [Porphyromonas crevioricanis]GAD05375.1 hypothetical protein PORCRE_1075 [Porphyromonas crevioricanis JCM 15906]SJZ85684.1 Predicted metal-binding protein [Porphyromonas crevioricanis]
MAIPLLSDDYSVSDKSVVWPLSAYIRHYHHPEVFVSYCQKCSRYGRTWSCPPFDFSPSDYLSPYHSIGILATRIYPNPNLNERILRRESSMKELYDGLIRLERAKLDSVLLDLEKEYPGMQAAYAGHCHFCPNRGCTRSNGLPCRFPHKMRPSLEALGFDLCRTTTELMGIELQWGQDGLLPDYYCLISGLLFSPSIPVESTAAILLRLGELRQETELQ